MISGVMQSALGARVLVLNKHYMALRVVSVRRAFSLLFRDQAEVISCEEGTYANYDFESWRQISELKEHFEANSHDWISTVNFDIAVPKIIRLLFYDRLPRTPVKFNRRNIYARDQNTCQYCGKKHSSSELSLDHIIPRSMGGTSTWDNIVCACTRCNVKKGGRTPRQAHMTLIRKPVKPKRNPVIHLHLNHHRYRSWKQFLDNAYWHVELT